MTTTSAAAADATVTLKCESCGAWNRIQAARATSGPKCGKCSTAIRLDAPIQLDDASFDRTINDSALPVLVDFYADWCGPCKMMAPFVAQLAAKSIGRALIAKVDTDAAQQAARRFNIRGIPTVIVFSRGKAVAEQSGAVPLSALEALLAKAG